MKNRFIEIVFYICANENKLLTQLNIGIMKTKESSTVKVFSLLSLIRVSLYYKGTYYSVSANYDALEKVVYGFDVQNHVDFQFKDISTQDDAIIALNEYFEQNVLPK